jgi:hypothetical protein
MRTRFVDRRPCVPHPRFAVRILNFLPTNMRSQFLLLAAVAAAALPISAQSIAPSTLPDATLSQVYTAVLTSTPSSASTTWSISSGALSVHGSSRRTRQPERNDHAELFA